MLYTENYTDLAHHIFHIYQPIFIIFLAQNSLIAYLIYHVRLLLRP